MLRPFSLRLRYWQTRTHCCGHIFTHDVSWAAQTGKHLLRTQSVSEQNQKHFLCPGHKICVRNKCCARGQTGKYLCRQQSVRNNVSSFADTYKLSTMFSPKDFIPDSLKSRVPLFISLHVRAVEFVILVKPIGISTHVLMSISFGTKIPTFLNILVLLKVVGISVISLVLRFSIMPTLTLSSK